MTNKIEQFGVCVVCGAPRDVFQWTKLHSDGQRTTEGKLLCTRDHSHDQVRGGKVA